MKDFTVYSKYETFVKQLSDENTEVVIRNSIASNYDTMLTAFTSELNKKCYTRNDVEMCIKLKDTNIATLLYVPIVDQYQKHFIVCVLFVNTATNTIIDKQCYVETVNPLCINNANIKDILNTMQNIVKN